MSGFFKVPNEVYDAFAKADPVAILVYMCLARNAAYSDRVSPFGYEVKRGECDMTLKQVADEVGITKSSARTRIEKLTQTGTISARRATQRRNVITLHCQAFAGDQRTDSAQPAHAERTDYARTAHVESHLSKKKTKTKTKTQDSSSAAADGESFDEFWRAYPRKVGKGQARRAYAKALKAVSHESVMQAIKADVAGRLSRTETQFIPHPSTWLNGEPWLDEASAPTKTGGRGRAASLGYDITDDSNYDVSDL